MNITSVKYITDDDGKNCQVTAEIDGTELFVPLAPDNRHYAEILKQVAAGTLTIAAAD